MLKSPGDCLRRMQEAGVLARAPESCDNFAEYFY